MSGHQSRVRFYRQGNVAGLNRTDSVVVVVVVVVVSVVVCVAVLVLFDGWIDNCIVFGRAWIELFKRDVDNVNLLHRVV